MQEIWKDIKGFENRYQVSNLGRIKSLNRIINHSNGTKHFVKGKILCLKKRKTGYQETCLRTNQNAKWCLVHRLVLETFNGFSKLHVNHIDGNKTNNKIKNLEYVTHLENMNHWTKSLKNKKRFGVTFNKKNQCWIAQLCVKDETIYLGSYHDEEKAYKRFFTAYLKYHGVAPW